MPRVAALSRERREPVADAGETDAVGVVHRPAAPDRETVAVDPNHVHIARPQCDPFLQDAPAPIDDRVDQPLDDFILADRPPRAPEAQAGPDGERLDL